MTRLHSGSGLAKIRTEYAVRLCPPKYEWEDNGGYKPGEDVTTPGVLPSLKGETWFHPYDGSAPFKVS